jgi:WD40 repeat protein
MTDVFISYSRKDIAFARLLHQALKENGLETWIDWQDIPPSVDWLAEVYEAIEQADAFVFVISETSLASEVCGLEMAHAAEHNKRLIPIVIKDVDAGQVPKDLAMLNWIFFEEAGEKFEEAMVDLVTAITVDQEWLKGHTRLENRALDWERKGSDRGLLLRGSDLTEAEAWLGQAAGKEPVPTALQAQYILKSREDATRRQRVTLGAVAAGLVISVALGVVAWTQRNVAVAEGDARATAQAEAEDQRNAAIEQSDLATSRYLSSRASASMNDQLDLSLLLAVRAAEISLTSDARGALLTALSARPYLETVLATSAMEFVQGVGLSPDGNLLAISYFHQIEIWDLTTYALKDMLEFPEDLPSYTWLGFSASVGSLIGCRPARVNQQLLTFCREWDLESEEDLGLLVDGIGRTDDWQEPGIAISPDGRLLSMSDDVNEVYIYSIPERDLLQGPLAGHEAAVTSAAFNPQASQLATADSHGSIILWDVASGEAIDESENVFNVEDPASGGGISGIAFSPDGEQILAAGDDHSVLIECETFTIVKRFHGYGSGNLLAEYRPDGTPVVQTITKEKVYLWDASTGQFLAGNPSTTFLSKQNIDSAVLDLAHMRLITVTTLTGVSGVNILVWKLERRLPFLRHPASGEAFTSIAYHPDPEQHMLATGGCARHDSQDETTCEQGKITFWDSQTGKVIGGPVLGHNSNVEVLAFNPEGSILASGFADGDIILWDVKSRKPIGDPLQLHQSWVEVLVFSPNGQSLASAATLDEDGFYLWDLSQNSPSATNYIAASEAQDWVEYLAFSPDGKTIASCTEVDGYRVVMLWDVQDHKVITTLESRPGAKSLAFFTPDGQTLLTAGNYGIRVWDSSDFTILAEPASNALDTPTIQSAALSPAGDVLASQLIHREITLWDSFTGQPLGDPIAIYDEDTSDTGNHHLAYSPDGSQIAIADDQGLFLWDMRVEQWIEAACHMANRDLTREEWRTYMGSEPYEETCR